MAKFAHLVFSEPPAGVPNDEYNQWYDGHVQEILAVDGWIAATRYELGSTAVAPGEETSGFRFLSVYELDIPPAEGVQNLVAAGYGSADSYIELKAAQGVDDPFPLPDWFPQIRFGAWNATGTGERILPLALP